MPGDQTSLILDQIRQASAAGQKLQIRGSGTKDFLGFIAPGLVVVDTLPHQGVINYRPEELVVTVRSGTRLSELNTVLAGADQYLAFDPPQFGGDPTVGGIVASGLSGPGRPFRGAVRDALLGLTLATSEGTSVHFGGEVMKNVAGYDVSRLMVGAMGTLGCLLDVSLKVMPKPEYESCVSLEVSRDTLVETIGSWHRQAAVSGASFVDGKLFLRFSGSREEVSRMVNRCPGEVVSGSVFSDLRDLKFSTSGDLLRLSVAANSHYGLDQAIAVDWAGGIRWLENSGLDFDHLEQGHAVQYFGRSELTERYSPLSSGLQNIHLKLKQEFDSTSLFNYQRLYGAW
jgi:glycolate oxidase FAD binding subunit